MAQRRDRVARRRLRREPRDAGARADARPARGRAAPPGRAAAGDRGRRRARDAQRARRRRGAPRGDPGRRGPGREGGAGAHGAGRPARLPARGRRRPAGRGAAAGPARPQAAGRPARAVRRAGGRAPRPLPRPLRRARGAPGAGARRRRSRAARADPRQPPLQRPALHGSGRPRDRRGSRRARDAGGPAGLRHGHRHRAGAHRPDLRPLLARAGVARPGRGGLGRGARGGARPRRRAGRAHRRREPPRRRVDVQRLPAAGGGGAVRRRPRALGRRGARRRAPATPAGSGTPCAAPERPGAPAERRRRSVRRRAGLWCEGRTPVRPEEAPLAFHPIRRRALLSVAVGAVLAGPGAAAAVAQDVDVVAGGLANPRGIDFGPGGALYVAESGKGGTGACLASPEGGQACYGRHGRHRARQRPHGPRPPRRPGAAVARGAGGRGGGRQRHRPQRRLHLRPVSATSRSASAATRTRAPSWAPPAAASPASTASARADGCAGWRTSAPTRRAATRTPGSRRPTVDSNPFSVDASRPRPHPGHRRRRQHAPAGGPARRHPAARRLPVRHGARPAVPGAPARHRDPLPARAHRRRPRARRSGLRGAAHRLPVPGRRGERLPRGRRGHAARGVRRLHERGRPGRRAARLAVRPADHEQRARRRGPGRGQADPPVAQRQQARARRRAAHVPPTGVAVGPNGDVYVADRGVSPTEGRIVRVPRG